MLVSLKFKKDYIQIQLSRDNSKLKGNTNLLRDKMYYSRYQNRIYQNLIKTSSYEMKYILKIYIKYIIFFSFFLNVILINEPKLRKI